MSDDVPPSAPASHEGFAQGLTGDRRKQIGAALVVLILAASLGLAWLGWWWFVLTQRETTDNAYVGGHQLLVVPQVAGTVLAVHVDDTQRVKAGQLLVELDPTDATVALDAARARLAQAVRDVRRLQGAASQDVALVDARRLDLAQAQADLGRREPLRASRAMAPEQIAHAKDRVAAARAALLAAQRQAAASGALVEGTEIAQHPGVLAARAAFVDAALRLQRTRIVAAVEGDVVQRTAQPGQQVAPGQALMRLVDTDSLWIDANFKESQLRNLRIGQPVTVEVDLYGSGVDFEGRVVGFSAGTGSAFALLPPQNAAGNWVKVVQRVPVRIALSPDAMKAHPLIVGLSARVKVDTHDRGGARLSSIAPAAAATTADNPRLADAQAEADRIIAANTGHAS